MMKPLRSKYLEVIIIVLGKTKKDLLNHRFFPANLEKYFPDVHNRVISNRLNYLRLNSDRLDEAYEYYKGLSEEERAAIIKEYNSPMPESAITVCT